MERIIDTGYAVTSGNIFEVRNNKAMKFAVGYNGDLTILGAINATTFVGNLTGNVSGSSGSCTGNAATATLAATATSAGKWTTARTLALTGDVTGSVSLDGSTVSNCVLAQRPIGVVS